MPESTKSGSLKEGQRKMFSDIRDRVSGYLSDCDSQLEWAPLTDMQREMITKLEHTLAFVQTDARDLADSFAADPSTKGA